MHAAETKIQALFDSTRQYVVPLFQRPYSWEGRQWGTLWDDLAELCEEGQPRSHFIGSIVTVPERSVPEGVTKYVLIDGQQRLTTILVLLAVIRDKARRQASNLADKIDDLLLKNRHQDGADVYKLLPTQVDRPAFCAVIDGSPPPKGSAVAAAYDYFDRRLRLSPDVALDRLHDAVRNHLALVSIVLDKDDNPHLIFESLNAKGRPLTQADLIRNYFFMRVDARLQDRLYTEHWKPMQDRLGDEMTEYIRHFLMRDGKVVRQNDVYLTLKAGVDRYSQDEIVDHLKDVAASSAYYAKLLRPAEEPSRKIRDRLERLNRYEATTAYPFLLSVYRDHDRKNLSEADFAAILDILETFLIRRFICGVPTSGLTRIFPALYGQARRVASLVDGVRHALRDKDFPTDRQFKEHFATAKVYGGDRSPKAKLILESLEASFGHKEAVDQVGLTIEHVMPRTPTDWWREHLGEDWEAVHEEWLDTVGNLTLTGYNSELSNADFPAKKARLQQSHLELNRYFTKIDVWDEHAIGRRGDLLAERAVAVWPDFANRGDDGEAVGGVDDVLEDVQLLIAQVVDHFGGEVTRSGKGKRVFYTVGDGKTLVVKYSKRHADYYWFGLHASTWAEAAAVGVTHFVFVLVPEGFAAVPVEIVQEYVAEAGSSPKSDGTVRHYHVLISTDATPDLFHHSKPTRIPLGRYYTSFGPNSDQLTKRR